MSMQDISCMLIIIAYKSSYSVTLQYLLSYTAVTVNLNSSTSRMKLQYQLCKTEAVLEFNAFVFTIF